MNSTSQNIIPINQDVSNMLFNTGSTDFGLCKKLTDSEPVYIAVLDHNYRYINFNEDYLKLVRSRHKSFMGKSICNTFGEDQFNKIIKPNLDYCFKNNKIEENKIEKNISGTFSYNDHMQHL